MRLVSEFSAECALRCLAASMARIVQSRFDFGLGFQVKVFKPLKVVPSSLDSGSEGLVVRRERAESVQRSLQPK